MALALLPAGWITAISASTILGPVTLALAWKLTEIWAEASRENVSKQTRKERGDKYFKVLLHLISGLHHLIGGRNHLGIDFKGSLRRDHVGQLFNQIDVGIFH